MHGREEGRKGEEGPRDTRSRVCVPERHWWLGLLFVREQRDGSPSPAVSGGLVLRWSSATQYVRPYPSPTLTASLRRSSVTQHVRPYPRPTLTASLGPPLLLLKSPLLGHTSNPQGPWPVLDLDQALPPLHGRLVLLLSGVRGVSGKDSNHPWAAHEHFLGCQEVMAKEARPRQASPGKICPLSP